MAAGDTITTIYESKNGRLQYEWAMLQKSIMTPGTLTFIQNGLEVLLVNPGTAARQEPRPRRYSGRRLPAGPRMRSRRACNRIVSSE